jgi:hypothetical protein
MTERKSAQIPRQIINIRFVAGASAILGSPLSE